MTKSWTVSKFKAFADNKINVTQTLKFQDGKVEDTVGKGENAGYQHFLLFRQCFQKATFSGSLKVGIVWIKELSPLCDTRADLFIQLSKYLLTTSII